MDLPLLFIPETWRRNQAAVCPSCGQGPRLSVHKDCPNKEADRAGNAHVYIDLTTGELHCIACGYTSSVDRWKNYCLCGVVFEGGEIWQGMGVEVGQAAGWQGDHFTQAAWFKARATQLGSLQTKLLGWSVCAFCGGELADGYFSKGGSRGGLCEACENGLLALFKARFTWRKRFKPCEWCGDRENRGGRIVKFRKLRISRFCFQLISRRLFTDEL